MRGVKAFEFHKVWVYFARAFGIQLVGTIEESQEFRRGSACHPSDGEDQGEKSR
jgi:hypothetical protein